MKPGPASPLAGCALVIVEDHADTLEAMQTMLELEGAQAQGAGSVGEALAQLDPRIPRTPPTAVLCDIELPGEDGYAFLARLRALESRAGVPRCERIPVVAVTARTGTLQRARALAAGFADHLGKPVSAARLVEAVRAVRRARG
ncbi:MAG: response regulator [Burkholderiales bacterium]|nr:response regulator [Burkholderiales bacterium]